MNAPTKTIRITDDASAFAYLDSVGHNYVREGDLVKYVTVCPRCGGTGYFGPMSINGGRCFECNASKSRRTESWGSPIRMARGVKADLARAARREREAAENRAKTEANRAAAAEAAPKVYPEVEALYRANSTFVSDWDAFLARVRRAAMNYGVDSRALSDALKTHRQSIVDSEREAERAASEWVGTEGKREIFEDVRFERAVFFSTAYGEQGMYFFKMDNNVLVWKTGSYPDLQKGMCYRIKATVKAHDEYKGTKQTVLTRVVPC